MARRSSPVDPHLITSALIEASSGLPPLSEAEARWISDRIECEGYYPSAKNIGGYGCLLPHKHGDDGLCMRRALAERVSTGNLGTDFTNNLSRLTAETSDILSGAAYEISRSAGSLVGKRKPKRNPYIRCWRTEAEGMRALICIARAEVTSTPIPIFCPECGEDIKLPANEGHAGIAGFVDDVKTGYKLCKLCYRVGAAIGGVDGASVDGIAQSDPLAGSLDDNEDAVNGYRSIANEVRPRAVTPDVPAEELNGKYDPTIRVIDGVAGVDGSTSGNDPYVMPLVDCVSRGRRFADAVRLGDEAPAQGSNTDDDTGFVPLAAGAAYSAYKYATGPSEKLQQRIEEVAARWKMLKERMDTNPKIARALKPHFDHWSDFYGKWQKGERDVDDANIIIAESNAAQSNADNVLLSEVKKIEPLKKEELSMSSAAEKAAFDADDKAREKQKELEKGFADKLREHRLKLVAAAGVVAGGAVIALKIAKKAVFPF